MTDSDPDLERELRGVYGEPRLDPQVSERIRQDFRFRGIDAGRLPHGSHAVTNFCATQPTGRIDLLVAGRGEVEC